MRAYVNSLRVGCILGLIVIFVSICISQLSDYSMTQYTIDDGLPSNECHKVIQDSLGYIWIASDRGLVRYDGYDFRTYGIQEGLTDLSCLDIVLDKNGDIWMFTFSNKIFKYEREHDYVFLYQHQDIINDLLGITKISGIQVDQYLSLHVSLMSVGVLSVDNQGQYALDRGEAPDSLGRVFTRMVDDNILVVSNSRGSQPLFSELVLKQKILKDSSSIIEYTVSHKNRKIRGEIADVKPISHMEGFKLSDSIDLVCFDIIRYYFVSDSIIIQKVKPRIADITLHTELGIIAAELDQQGVTTYASPMHLIQQHGNKLMSNISATGVFSSINGDLWVTTLDNGLFKFAKDDINKDYSFLEKNISHIEKSPQGIYYVVDNRTLMFRDWNNVHQKLFSARSGKIFALTYDKFTDQIIVCNRNSIALSRNNEVKEIVFQYPHSKTWVHTALSNAFCMEDGNYILPQADYFFMSSSLEKKEVFCSYPKEKFIKVLAAAYIDEGHYLLGTASGLYEFEDLDLQRVKYSDSIIYSRPWEVDLRINDIKKLGPWYILATQGNGVEFRDLQGNIIHRIKSDGLVSDVIEEIFIDSKENIYLCTNSGLSKLWFNDNDSLLIRNYTKLHGLPSNEVNDITEVNDTLFIATSKGVGVLVGEPKLASTHNVLIEKVMANKKTIAGNNFELSYNENNLSIQYKTIDHIMQGDITYRYKLNESWPTYTSSTTANLSGLGYGDYVFKVQSINMDSNWSDYTTIEFTIHPPWWSTAWFRLLTMVMILGCAYYLYKRRTRYLKNKIDVEREVRDLEKAALQAQMNPHFIFNCLNSIQNFVMQNEKEEAMKYLGQFAKLIRQNLNASVESLVQLDQEIAMLTNYLDLEKLRLNHRFDYEIGCEPSLPVEDIKIPSLLIQPFVENAVIHGMRNRDVGGMITIHFAQDAGRLQVTVTDNGQGHRSNIDTKSHKSVGMSITQKRLAFLNDSQSEKFAISPTYSSEGTTVVVLIKL